MGKNKSKYSYSKKIVSCFGFFGYISCVFQWFWGLVLYSSLLKLLTNLYSNSDNIADDVPLIAITPPVEASEPNVFMIFLGVIVMGAAIALVIYSFMKIPSTIAKANKKVVNQTVELAAPVISKIQHKPDNEKFRLRITPTIVISIKVFLIIVPIIFSLASGLLSEQFMDYKIATFISFWLFAFSMMLFIIQYCLAYILHVKEADIL